MSLGASIEALLINPSYLPYRRRPGTLAHAEGALTMLGFCHAPPPDDVTRPRAAHVIYRQKRLKQKTRSLNMTKTAFRHDDLIRRVGDVSEIVRHPAVVMLRLSDKVNHVVTKEVKGCG